jgi:hypothetical protein
MTLVKWLAESAIILYKWSSIAVLTFVLIFLLAEEAGRYKDLKMRGAIADAWLVFTCLIGAILLILWALLEPIR